MNEKIFFRFRGEKIQPSNIRAGELGDLLDAIEETIAQAVISQYPRLTKDNLVIGLAAINAGSLDLQFTTALPEVVIPTYERMARALHENEINAFPVDIYEPFGKILHFARKQNSQIDLDILKNGQRLTLATISPDFVLPEAAFITGETTLYGELVRVGGVEPKAEIKTISGKTYFCPFSKDLAPALGKLLYRQISVTGIAKWNALTYEIKQFNIVSLNDYQPESLTQTFTELREQFGDYFNDIDDVNAYVSSLRKG